VIVGEYVTFPIYNEARTGALLLSFASLRILKAILGTEEPFKKRMIKKLFVLRIGFYRAGYGDMDNRWFDVFDHSRKSSCRAVE
jgi:hypothetical protein